MHLAHAQRTKITRQHALYINVRRVLANFDSELIRAVRTAMRTRLPQATVMHLNIAALDGPPGNFASRQ